MDIQATHEIHQRRLGRNVGVGLALVLFCAIVFSLTVVKVRRGADKAEMQGYDHVMRPAAESQPAALGTGAGQ